MPDTLFDSAPIGGAVTAPDGRWQQVNTTLATMLGYSDNELQATTLLAITHPDDLAETREAIRTLAAGECDVQAFDKRLLAKDGTWRWVHATTTLQHDADGAKHFITYVWDISARRQGEADVRASEEKYRRLFESAKDGILILDASTGRVVDANPFMTELTGFAHDTFVGKLLWEIGPFADTAASKVSFAELQANQYVRYDDLPLRTSDGREVAVEFVSNVYLVSGKKVIQCNIRDITLRKGGEEVLRLRERALEAVAHGVIITDVGQPDNVIIYASSGFTRLTGYEVNEVLGRDCRFLQGPGTDPVAVSKMRDAIREGRPCSVELLNYRKDGTSFWNGVALSPVKDAEGRVTNVVGVQTDVTGRRQLESQFLQAQKMEAVGRLAGGVAHDFNNLLSVILSYAELIVGELVPDDPTRADMLEIMTAAQRATDLTRQLLAFSRQQVLETKVLSVNRLLAGMEKMLGRLLGADIAVTMLPSADLHSIRADPGKLEQIMMNLAVNARDAMPQGGSLTIETANVELDEAYAAIHHGLTVGSYVLLAVSDTGTGMDKDTLARIFEPFFTTKGQGKGTGLGLATVFGIVKQSGGHIFVYSEPGKGSTFKVYFPSVGAIAEDAAAPQPAPEPEQRCGTILLVEDEDQVRVVARNILRQRGHVVLDAPNAGEALLICEQHGGNIDLLLTDVVLPRMSGRQLADRLLPMRPAMKVLFMSGYTDDAILQHGIIDSGVAFLQKPFTPTSLARKVAEVLQGKR